MGGEPGGDRESLRRTGPVADPPGWVAGWDGAGFQGLATPIDPSSYNLPNYRVLVAYLAVGDSVVV